MPTTSLSQSGCEATVHGLHRAGDHGRVRTGYEGHELSNLAGMDVPFDSHEPTYGMGHRPGCRIHVGVGWSGLDGIDGDAPRAEVARKAPHHALDGGLGERIGGGARKGYAIAVGRADDDNAAVGIHAAG